MYPQTLVSSFPGLISVARVNEREQLMSLECSKHQVLYINIYIKWLNFYQTSTSNLFLMILPPSGTDT